MTAYASTTERVVVNRFSGLAIEGFDPVAYFVDGAAEPGSEDFEAPQDGAVWRFRNQGNRASFLAHPEIYGPQFGGYDPVDLARGVTVAGSPRFWLRGSACFTCQRSDDRFAQEATSTWTRKVPVARQTISPQPPARVKAIAGQMISLAVTTAVPTCA